jgi:hypothetical protein
MQAIAYRRQSRLIDRTRERHLEEIINNFRRMIDWVGDERTCSSYI